LYNLLIEVEYEMIKYHHVVRVYLRGWNHVLI